MTYYYYNEAGVVKMTSEEKMETDLECVELPEQNLSGKLARFDGSELILEDNPLIVAEGKKEALELLKIGLKSKAEAGTLTLEDMGTFIKNFL